MKTYDTFKTIKMLTPPLYPPNQRELRYLGQRWKVQWKAWPKVSSTSSVSLPKTRLVTLNPVQSHHPWKPNPGKVKLSPLIDVAIQPFIFLYLYKLVAKQPTYSYIFLYLLPNSLHILIYLLPNILIYLYKAIAK